MDTPIFDTVIIGAGTAGSLLAKRLTENPRHRVLLLEAGRRDDYAWIHVPVGYLYCIGNPRTDWLYKTEPSVGLNGRQLLYPRGKTLGGCSSINGMIYMRGQSRDYEHWAELLADDQWRWDHVLPAFMRHEDHWLGDAGQASDAEFAKFHGNGGEWRVEKQRLRWDILDAFSQAAQQAGIPATEDFNRGNNEGVGYFQVNQKAGWRWNTAKAFLRPADGQARPNLTVWTQAQATQLLLARTPDGRLRCNGVRVQHKGKLVDVQAQQQVLLCAGAINSPQLLQLSGIGPGQLLHKHGIPVQIDLPGVGENLQDHLQIRAVYKVQGTPTLNEMTQHWLGKARIGLEYALHRTGPMSMAPSQLGAFTRSSPERDWPNLQFHVQPLSLDAFGQPLHPFPAFTASVCNLNPSSRGSVRIGSANWQQAPAIQPNYLSTAQDRQVAADSLRVVRRIAAQPALAPYQPEEWKPGPQYDSDADLIRLAGDIATTIFHPVGTTKMGHDDDPMAVLNARFELRDDRGGTVHGLRVVDAGAMPTITSGNTNSPTLMMAEKAAGWLTGR